MPDIPDSGPGPLPDSPSPDPITACNVIPRLINALGPIGGGLIIDLIDLVSWGPVGIIAGFFLGGFIAYWIGGIYQWSRRARITVGILAGIYCSIPMTEFVPIATILGGAARFFESPGRRTVSDAHDQEADQDQGAPE